MWSWAGPENRRFRDQLDTVINGMGALFSSDHWNRTIGPKTLRPSIRYLPHRDLTLIKKPTFSPGDVLLVHHRNGATASRDQCLLILRVFMGRYACSHHDQLSGSGQVGEESCAGDQYLSAWWPSCSRSACLGHQASSEHRLFRRSRIRSTSARVPPGIRVAISIVFATATRLRTLTSLRSSTGHLSQMCKRPMTRAM